MSQKKKRINSKFEGKKVYYMAGTKFEVDARYSIYKPLGHGAYGFVAAAKDKLENVKCAVKKIPKIFQNLEDGKRILREIMILRTLKHENVLSLKDIMTIPNANFSEIYLVTELMACDLHEVIRSKQILTQQHVQYFLYQILRGLKYIHSAHILHRDLKPGNILVNENCDLKICDFGLARGFNPLESKKEMTEYVVTRWYRAPELLLCSQEYTPAIDLWSVGCIFGELINRRCVFPGKDYLHQIKLIISALGTPGPDEIQHLPPEAIKYLQNFKKTEPTPWNKLFPNATAEEIDLLSKLLVFDPKKRITAEEALRHPYLKRYSNPNDEPVSDVQFSFEYDNKPIDEETLRRMLIQQMQHFHPNCVVKFPRKTNRMRSLTRESESRDDVMKTNYKNLTIFIEPLIKDVPYSSIRATDVLETEKFIQTLQYRFPNSPIVENRVIENTPLNIEFDVKDTIAILEQPSQPSFITSNATPKEVESEYPSIHINYNDTINEISEIHSPEQSFIEEGIEALSIASPVTNVDEGTPDTSVDEGIHVQLRMEHSNEEVLNDSICSYVSDDTYSTNDETQISKTSPILGMKTPNKEIESPENFKKEFSIKIEETPFLVKSKTPSNVTINETPMKEGDCITDYGNTEESSIIYSKNGKTNDDIPQFSDDETIISSNDDETFISSKNVITSPLHRRQSFKFLRFKTKKQSTIKHEPIVKKEIIMNSYFEKYSVEGYGQDDSDDGFIEVEEETPYKEIKVEEESEWQKRLKQNLKQYKIRTQL